MLWSNPGHPIIFLSTCSPDVLLSPGLQTCSVPVAQIPLCLEQGLLLLLQALPCSLSPSWPVFPVGCYVRDNHPPILTSALGLGFLLAMALLLPRD